MRRYRGERKLPSAQRSTFALPKAFPIYPSGHPVGVWHHHPSVLSSLPSARFSAGSLGLSKTGKSFSRCALLALAGQERHGPKSRDSAGGPSSGISGAVSQILILLVRGVSPLGLWDTVAQPYRAGRLSAARRAQPKLTGECDVSFEKDPASRRRLFGGRPIYGRDGADEEVD